YSRASLASGVLGIHKPAVSDDLVRAAQTARADSPRWKCCGRNSGVVANAQGCEQAMVWSDSHGDKQARRSRARRPCFVMVSAVSAHASAPAARSVTA